jgi:hypothetical protein
MPRIRWILEEQPIKKVAEKSIQPIDIEGVIPRGLRDIFMSDDRLYNEFYAVRVVMGDGTSEIKHDKRPQSLSFLRSLPALRRLVSLQQ